MKTNVKLDEKLNNIYNLKTNEEYEKTEIGLNKEIVERITERRAFKTPFFLLFSFLMYPNTEVC